MVDADRAASDTTVRGVTNRRCAAVHGGTRAGRVSGVRTQVQEKVASKNVRTTPYSVAVRVSTVKS